MSGILAEETYAYEGGVLRVVGDFQPGMVHLQVKDIAFGEYQCDEGIYGPLNAVRVVMILSTPSAAKQICRSTDEQIRAVATLLGMTQFLEEDA